MASAQFNWGMLPIPLVSSLVSNASKTGTSHGTSHTRRGQMDMAMHDLDK